MLFFHTCNETICQATFKLATFYFSIVSEFIHQFSIQESIQKSPFPFYHNIRNDFELDASIWYEFDVNWLIKAIVQAFWGKCSAGLLPTISQNSLISQLKAVGQMAHYMCGKPLKTCKIMTTNKNVTPKLPSWYILLDVYYLMYTTWYTLFGIHYLIYTTWFTLFT